MDVEYILLIVVFIFLAALIVVMSISTPRPVINSGLQSRNNRPVARSLSIREPVAKNKRDRYNGSKRPVSRLNVNSNINSDNNIANHEAITTGYQIDELMNSGMKRNEAMKWVEQMKNKEAIKYATIHGGDTSEFHSRK